MNARPDAVNHIQQALARVRACAVQCVDGGRLSEPESPRELELAADDLREAIALLRDAAGPVKVDILPSVYALRAELLQFERLQDSCAAFLRGLDARAGDVAPFYGPRGDLMQLGRNECTRMEA